MSIFLVNEFNADSDLTKEDINNVKFHAANGNGSAQYHLALIYDTGRHLPRDPKQAEKYYKLAAEQNNKDAQYYLYKLYSDKNSGIRNDAREATKWLQKAAENGHKEAELTLKTLIN